MATQTVQPTIQQLAMKMMEVANAFVGTREEGGNNRGEQVEAFLAIFGVPAGNPWCACFVAFCAAKAYGFLMGFDTARPKLPLYRKIVQTKYFPLDPLCANVVAQSKTRNTWLPVYQVQNGMIRPQQGWLVLYDWNHDGHADHIGIVARWDWTTHTLHTIEGNTSDESARDGDAVALKDRSLAPILGFVRTY